MEWKVYEIFACKVYLSFNNHAIWRRFGGCCGKLTIDEDFFVNIVCKSYV
jgi:hypothetical protein